jgi:hypothetical protein
MLLDIGPALPPDTEITSCATIGIDGEDGYQVMTLPAWWMPYSWSNLRVQKYFWWGGMTA